MTKEHTLRKVAKLCKLTFYFTGEPCKRGHVYLRKTSRGTCVECKREDCRAKYYNHYDEYAAKRKTLYHNDPEKYREKALNYHRENLEENREKIRLRSIEWRKKNPGKRTANYRQYNMSKEKRIPPWANLERIKEIYVSAGKLGYSVDHIIPLRGKTVSGLHVETNLQVIPLIDNIRKSNHFNGEVKCT